MTYSYRKASRTEKEVVFELYRVVISAYISTIWGWNEAWQEKRLCYTLQSGGNNISL